MNRQFNDFAKKIIYPPETEQVTEKIIGNIAT